MAYRCTRSRTNIDIDVTQADSDVHPLSFSPSISVQAGETTPVISSLSRAEEEIYTMSRRNAISAATGQTAIDMTTSPEKAHQRFSVWSSSSNGDPHLSQLDKLPAKTRTASSLAAEENKNAAKAAPPYNLFPDLVTSGVATIVTPKEPESHLVEAWPLRKQGDEYSLVPLSPKGKGKGKAEELATALPTVAIEDDSHHTTEQATLNSISILPQSSFERRKQNYLCLDHSKLFASMPPFDPHLFMEGPHEEYKMVSMHTAKCTVCKCHNQAIMFMCTKCTVSICQPCADGKCATAKVKSSGEEADVGEVNLGEQGNSRKAKSVQPGEGVEEGTSTEERKFDWCGPAHDVFEQAYLEWKEESPKEGENKTADDGSFWSKHGVRFYPGQGKQGGRKKKEEGSVKKPRRVWHGAAEIMTPTKASPRNRASSKGKTTPVSPPTASVSASASRKKTNISPPTASTFASVPQSPTAPPSPGGSLCQGWLVYNADGTYPFPSPVPTTCQSASLQPAPVLGAPTQPASYVPVLLQPSSLHVPEIGREIQIVLVRGGQVILNASQRAVFNRRDPAKGQPSTTLPPGDGQVLDYRAAPSSLDALRRSSMQTEELYPSLRQVQGPPISVSATPQQPLTVLPPGNGEPLGIHAAPSSVDELRRASLEIQAWIHSFGFLQPVPVSAMRSTANISDNGEDTLLMTQNPAVEALQSPVKARNAVEEDQNMLFMTPSPAVAAVSAMRSTANIDENYDDSDDEDEDEDEDAQMQDAAEQISPTWRKGHDNSQGQGHHSYAAREAEDKTNANNAEDAVVPHTPEAEAKVVVVPRTPSFAARIGRKRRWDG